MALLRKFTLMAVLGAIGAAAGAVVGEVLFVVDAAPRDEPRSICLLFDVSGSMRDLVETTDGVRTTQLVVLQEAAADFVDRQDLDVDQMGLAVFSSDGRVVSAVGHDPVGLKGAIRGLRAAGGTNLGAGFEVARSMLAGATGERWILTFTDGKPETSSTHETPAGSALSAAEKARAEGIRIVAIGTALADEQLLVKATGSQDNVIVSDPQALAEAFRRTEEVINRQMLASASGVMSFRRNALMTGCWAALIAIGAALGLVAAQNRHLRRRPLNPREGAIVVAGGLVTGLAAGAAGQSLFYVLASVPSVAGLGRLIAWTILGGGVGWGMGFFVPNLQRRRAAAAGAAAGVAAALCFLTVVPLVGDPFGRLLSAALLGLATGLTTVLVEAVYRRAWLVVHWSPKEKSDLALGATPVVLGSTSDAHVLLPESACPSPVMARISLDGGLIRMDDLHSGGGRALQDGDVLTYGPLRIEVRASGDAAATSASPAAAQDRTPPAPESASAFERARAREERWYSVEVPPGGTRASRRR